MRAEEAVGTGLQNPTVSNAPSLTTRGVVWRASLRTAASDDHENMAPTINRVPIDKPRTKLIRRLHSQRNEPFLECPPL